MDSVSGFSSSTSNLTSSSRLLEDIVTELECPVSLDLKISAATLSCMHTFHENYAIELCGPDKDNPKLGAKCPLCSRPVMYWKKNFEVESLVERVQLLQEKMKAEEIEKLEEFNRLKAAEEYWRTEYSRLMIMQELYGGEFNSQSLPTERGIEEDKRFSAPKISIMGSLMQCFGGDNYEHEHWL